MHSLFHFFNQYFKEILLVIFILFSIILWYIVINENRNGILTFAVLNIGQGDAIFIESPTGTQVIVDGGPARNLLREIPKVLPFYDRNIDMIIVTNPDKDHYEGFIPFLKKYSVDVVLEPGTNSTTETYSLFEKDIEERNIPKVIARRGQIIDLGAGVFIEILFPDRDISGLSSNDGSIVMKLVYGDTSILLQGDSTAKIEEYLVDLDKGELKNTILKVGHHGSRTSTMEKYVEVVSPQWAVISSGISNSYGHPHKETLDTLAKLDIPTLDTCNNGRIIFQSDGKEFILKNKNPKPAVVGCKF